MIVLDTHVLVFDALDPKRLSRRARAVLDEGFDAGTLACSDISLWELGMLIAKGRIDPGPDAGAFIDDLLQSRAVRVLPVSTAIAVLAQSDAIRHGDPADRIIAATALAHRARLLTADAQLRKVKSLGAIW